MQQAVGDAGEKLPEFPFRLSPFFVVPLLVGIARSTFSDCSRTILKFTEISRIHPFFLAGSSHRAIPAAYAGQKELGHWRGNETRYVAAIGY